MKGIVFTEFLDMVEARYSLAVADRIITASAPPSGGVYTSVGAYAHEELVGLLVALSAETGAPIPTLLHVYGEHLFGRFVVHFPQFFTGDAGALDFLEGLETRIHTEVRKLYPEAELPEFGCRLLDADTLEMDYRSTRHLEDFAHGLIDGCLRHFGEPVAVSRAVIEDPEHPCVRFVLKRAAVPAG